MRGTSLPNGDLIVCGGDTGPTLSDEYLHYEDGSNHWTNVGTMKKARFSHSSVWIDGCLFTTGGCELLGNGEYDSERIRFRRNDSDDSGRAIWPDENEWGIIGIINELLGNGEYDSDDRIRFRGEYDSGRAIWPDENEWQATSHHEMFSIQDGVKERREMPISLDGHTATIFAPHKIIVCGGSPTRYVNKTFFISLKY